jgi:hypothetical protein
MADAKPILNVKGVNGQIRLYDGYIVISRRGALGFLTQGHKGEKTVFIHQISSVQFKDPGLATNGYIQFAFLGGHETKGGLFNATKDENSVMFNRGQRKDFGRMRDEVMARISSGGVSASTPSTSVADELTKLAGLRDQGILSSDEFEAAKRRVLGKS